MGSLVLPELRLDCGFSSKANVRKKIDQIFAQFPWIHGDGVSEQILKLQDHANSLRDEMKKIDPFKRELPLCMILLNDALVATEEELAQYKKSNGEPLLEEFIPLKDDKVQSNQENDISCRDKMNWMSSVQLCNSDNDKLALKLENTKKRTEEEMNRPAMDNLFPGSRNRTLEMTILPFKGCRNNQVMAAAGKDSDEFHVPTLSLRTPEFKRSTDGIDSTVFCRKTCSSRSASPPATNVQPNSNTGHQHHSARKQRRCWSDELHRRFIDALQQLGGARAATPKQIRDIMGVDGLTNDEVKSHLQKYRLHSRRHSVNTSCRSVGLWMSEEQCSESSNQYGSQSSSPEGPLNLGGSPNDHSGSNEGDEGHY